MYTQQRPIRTQKRRVHVQKKTYSHTHVHIYTYFVLFFGLLYVVLEKLLFGCVVFCAYVRLFSCLFSYVSIRPIYMCVALPIYMCVALPIYICVALPIYMCVALGDTHIYRSDRYITK